MTNEEYRAVDAISSSDLDYLDTNPYLFSLGIRPQKKSKAMEFGTLVHSLTLEPEKFDEEYAVEDFEGCHLNKNTKAYKEAKAEWLQNVGNRKIVSKDDFEKAKEIADRARKLIEPFDGVAEESHFTNWNEHIKVKCRPDFLTNDGLLIDLKTISNINLNNDYLLAKAIKDRKYHRQLGFYKMVLELKRIEIKEVLIVFANTDDLWVRGIRLNHEDIEIGRIEANNILDRYNSILLHGLDLGSLFKPIQLPQY
ncbi:exodeoxyribonuclease VIII [Nitratiruptor phage NrS-5]|uniref:PD-(D/E)XK nuclease-like domain-containing protein n=1 Tax=unclassified Nitratiruptor TaxID=2624044 RepID=UPI001914E791|nr:MULTISPECIES: PD-(D/E)XK nuclease-like domain-containing protein [unclassified Nitratiruptor]BCD61721.1 exodeoxyribonuclease VIII [Nitratiruptor sp. YY08-13]BCD65656.1 exodeoxyribonuclease VIII [Nitratiruptor sp. YY08-26]BCD83199.1 exodeoxyribonuclease VIII [Nitratiruptor phage NrS-4]BCD83258.1 exodeoxyribonuclease VIII [Nitratiruptor phage NrS-5]